MRCAAVRAMIKPDWPCRVQRLYADQNMGCGRRISSGLNWVFDQVSEAIILEDDCLPHSDFFRWTAAMLARYRNDRTVMSVSGSVAEGSNSERPHYSRYPFIWGWATWRRAWGHYDFTMRDWPNKARGNWLRERLPNSSAVRFWRKKFWAAYLGRVDTWDYQWVYSCWNHGGLSLIPPKNLVANIGGTVFATHPQIRNIDLPVWPLPKNALIPVPVFQDRTWDDQYERNHFSGPDLGIWLRIIRRIRRIASNK